MLQDACYGPTVIRLSGLRLLSIAVALIAAFGVNVRNSPAQAFPELVWPIDDVDLDRFVDLLQLSDAQEQYMRAHHEQYLSRREVLFGEQMEEYGAARGYANQVYSRQMEGDLSDAFDEAYRLSQKLNETLLAMDEEFYESLIPILTEYQIGRLPRARNAHLRRLYRLHQGALPEAQVDIIELLTPMSDVEEERFEILQSGMMNPPTARKFLPLSTAEMEKAEQLIVIYEPQIVAARKSLRDALRSGRSAGFERMDIGRWLEANGLRERDRPDLAERRNELLRESTKRHEAPSLRLAALNRRFLAELQFVLPETKGAELEALYLQTAYPAVYPDISAADDQYKEILTWNHLTDDQREAIASRYEEYTAKHARVSELMAESITHIQSKWRWADEPLVARDLRQRLRDLGMERIELNRAQSGRIAEFLTPEQIEQMPKWKYVDGEPPRPWDPGYRPRREDRRARR